MNKKFLFLTKTSIAKKLKSKWFLAVNVLLLFLIISLVNINSIIATFGGDFNEALNLVVIDKTNDIYSSFSNHLLSKKDKMEKDFTITKTEKTYDKTIAELKKKILLVIERKNGNLQASIISEGKIDSLTYQWITSSLEEAKYEYLLANSSINQQELLKISTPMEIERVILDQNKKSSDENLQTTIGTVFPTLILPFFMLIIFLVQMIGSEIYEEKSTRSMEIIISNVSAKTHFFSKILSSNLFVIIQGILLTIYGGLGLIIKNLVGESATTSFTKEISTIWESLKASGFLDSLSYLIPIFLILLLLSFLVYSLTAGILASLTVNMDDYQQIQTPIMLLLVAAYYLSIMSSMFEGSTLIKVLSYLPFISCLLSPSLLVLNQITILDSMISILILILFNYLLIKKGLKLYKNGILNYSNEKIWTKLKKVWKHNI